MRSSSLTLAAAAVSGVLLVSGCSTLGVAADDSSPNRAAASSPSVEDETSVPEEPVDPDTPTSWGPTHGEVDEARALVSDWTPEQLAGQVIVGRFHGTDPEEPADLVRDLHLAGVSVTSANILDEAQVLAMNAAITQAAAEDGRTFPPVIGVDQEGGYVSHLGDIATDFPHFQSAGLAIEADGKEGRRVTRVAALTTGLELRGLGFTWVFAPVADVTIGAADPTIGARSPSPDTAVAAIATASAIKGYDAAGIVSTVKHFPGHGTATTDSHDTLPARRLEPGRDRGARPAALRGGHSQERARGDAQPPRPHRHRPRRPGEHGARGLRPAARRPGFRGRHHHRLARHGCGRWPAASRRSRRSTRAPTCC